MENSDTAKALAGPWLNGSSSFTEDLTRVLGSVSTGDVQNLTVSALLMRMMAAPGADAGQVRQLLESARKLGLADVRVGAPAEAPDVAARNGTPVA